MELPSSFGDDFAPDNIPTPRTLQSARRRKENSMSRNYWKLLNARITQGTSLCVGIDPV